LFLNNTTATTGRSWYLNSYSNGSLYVGNATAGDIFNFSSAGVATFSAALSGTSATFSSSVTARNGSSGTAFVTTNAVDADFTIETVSGGTTKIGTSGNKLSILAGVGNMTLSKPSSDTILTIGTTGEVPTIKAGGTNTDLKLEATGSEGNLYFYTNSTLKMIVKNDGTVGIGITTPLSPLHQVTELTNYTGESRIGGSTTAFGIVTSYTQNAATSGSIYLSPGYGNSGILFKLGAGSGNTNQLVLTGGGNVGINTTTPGTKLEIAGAAIADPLMLRLSNTAGLTYYWDMWRDNTTGYLNFGSALGGSKSTYVSISTTGVVQPGANGTQDLGTSSLRWATVYTSDLSLSNGIGDYTIVEGEDDLFLYNNKSNKVYKFMLAEVDPANATPKKST
jgi:hypothetical protein